MIEDSHARSSILARMKTPQRDVRQERLKRSKVRVEALVPRISVLRIRPNALQDRERVRMVEPECIAEVLLIVSLLHGAKAHAVVLKNIIRLVEVAKPVSCPNQLADVIDHRVHGAKIEAKDDQLGMIERMVEADRIGESRTAIVGLDAQDVPAMLLNIGQ